MNIYIREQALDLVKYLTKERADELMNQASIQDIPAGTVIYKPGDQIGEILIVLSGELVIEKDKRFLGKMCFGEILNEINYLQRIPAMYQLRTNKASQIARLRFEDLDAFIAADPEQASRIHAALSDSLCVKIIRHTYLERT